MPLTRVRDRQTRVRHRKLAENLKNFAPVTAIQRLISAPGPTSFGTASMHAFHESSHQCHAVMHIPGDLTGPPGVALEGTVRPRHGPFVPAFLRVDFWHLEHLIPDFESFQSPVVIGPAHVPTWSNFGHVWS